MNYKIFSEYIQIYEKFADHNFDQILKLSTAMNESCSLEKRIWLEMINASNEEQKLIKSKRGH